MAGRLKQPKYRTIRRVFQDVSMLAKFLLNSVVVLMLISPLGNSLITCTPPDSVVSPSDQVVSTCEPTSASFSMFSYIYLYIVILSVFLFLLAVFANRRVFYPKLATQIGSVIIFADMLLMIMSLAVIISVYTVVPSFECDKNVYSMFNQTMTLEEKGTGLCANKTVSLPIQGPFGAKGEFECSAMCSSSVPLSAWLMVISTTLTFLYLFFMALEYIYNGRSIALGMDDEEKSRRLLSRGLVVNESTENEPYVPPGELQASKRHIDPDSRSSLDNDAFQQHELDYYEMQDFSDGNPQRHPCWGVVTCFARLARKLRPHTVLFQDLFAFVKLMLCSGTILVIIWDERNLISCWPLMYTSYVEALKPQQIISLCSPSVQIEAIIIAYLVTFSINLLVFASTLIVKEKVLFARSADKIHSWLQGFVFVTTVTKIGMLCYLSYIKISLGCHVPSFGNVCSQLTKRLADGSMYNCLTGGVQGSTAYSQAGPGGCSASVPPEVWTLLPTLILSLVYVSVMLFEYHMKAKEALGEAKK